MCHPGSKRYKWFISKLYISLIHFPTPACSFTSSISRPNNFSCPFNRCVQVCSVTGPSVVDFNGKVYSIPDRCVYSLSKPRDSSTFEILAGFKERRLVDVPFLDYLKLSLQNPTVTINLEQGGRVRVRRTRPSSFVVMGRSFLLKRRFQNKTWGFVLWAHVKATATH